MKQLKQCSHVLVTGAGAVGGYFEISLNRREISRVLKLPPTRIVKGKLLEYEAFTGAIVRLTKKHGICSL